MWEGNIFPQAAALTVMLMGRKKTGKTQESSQRLALLPRSAVIAGLPPSRASLWVCCVFPAWPRGSRVFQVWLLSGVVGLHASARLTDLLGPRHTSCLLSAGGGEHKPASHTPLVGSKFDTNVCHMPQGTETNTQFKKNLHFLHLSDLKLEKSVLRLKLRSWGFRVRW